MHPDMHFLEFDKLIAQLQKQSYPLEVSAIILNNKKDIYCTCPTCIITLTASRDIIAPS